MILLILIKKKLMKKINYILVAILFIFITGCQSVQKALVPSKNSGGDEFLVKKKSPLIMPPDYNDLPKPETETIDEKKSEQIDIKSLIKSNSNIDEADNNQIQTKKSSIEKLVLDKINKK